MNKEYWKGEIFDAIMWLIAFTIKIGLAALVIYSVVEIEWGSLISLRWTSVATITLLLGILRAVLGHVSLNLADKAKSFSEIPVVLRTHGASLRLT